MILNGLSETPAEKFAREQGGKESDLTLIERFKSKVLNFTEQFNNLKNRRIDSKRYPDLAREQSELIKKGGIVNNTISALTGAVDKVYSFFKGVTGMDGLGVLPLLPVAAISIAVAAITKWTTDAYEFNKRVDAIQALEAKGYSPEKAGQIVSQQFYRPSLLSSITGPSMLPILAVVGVLFFLWRGGKIK